MVCYMSGEWLGPLAWKEGYSTHDAPHQSNQVELLGRNLQMFSWRGILSMSHWEEVQRKTQKGWRNHVS